jgi:hypothetical protein
MTAKDYLLRAWQIDARIDEKIAEIEHLEEKRERIMAKLTAGRASNLSGMPRGGRYDWTESVESVIETDELIRDAVNALRAEIMELCRVKREVADAIDDVYVRTRDIRYKRELDLHYRNFLSWPEIAEKMGYDIRHVTRLHGEALLCVKVPKEDANA